MACSKPQAMINRGNRLTPVFRSQYDQSSMYKLLEIPCGKCVSCRLANAKQWQLRSVHEMKYHVSGCFVTFTYNPEFVPRAVDSEGNETSILELRERDMQLFIKRLRRRLDYDGESRIRYKYCGEYGGRTGRPHYHALIFGFEPSDKVLRTIGKSGFPTYTSKYLSSLWYDETTGKSLGYIDVGTLTEKSAGYVARYTVKKATIANDELYIRYCPVTGDRIEIRHEYARQSLGLCRLWFDQYFMANNSHAKGFITHEGHKFAIPRYYLKRFKMLYPDEYAQFVIRREAYILSREVKTTSNLIARELIDQNNVDTYLLRSL